MAARRSCAAWYRSALEAERYCRKHDLSTASLMRWVHHLLRVEDLHKHAEDLQKLRRKKPERQPKTAQPNRPKRPRRNRYSVRTDSGPIALRAFWSMHVEAMNWSGMSGRDYATALLLSPRVCASGATGSMTAKWRSTGGRIFIRVPARR